MYRVIWLSHYTGVVDNMESRTSKQMWTIKIYSKGAQLMRVGFGGVEKKI
jgi:hypothetical protein